MKNEKLTIWSKLAVMLSIVVLVSFTACDDETESVPDPDVAAVFTSTPDGNAVTFINASSGATTYAWDFGDGEMSTEENPVHTYAAAGTYSVTLTASNPTNTNAVTQDVLTAHAGDLSRVIVGQEWVAARGAGTWCYSQGADATADNTWGDQSPQNFGWGDVEGGWALLITRPSLANDVYTFNADNSMNVDFKGDLWAEYSMWESEGDLDINNIPNNANGDDMSAFGNPNNDWTFAIDDAASTIVVSGLGAHILNPRMAHSTLSPDPVLTPQTSVSYDIVRVVEVEGAADTLVLYADVAGISLGHYITLHAYENEADIPTLIPLPSPQHPNSVLSTTIGHTFLAEDGTGAGVGSVAGPYDVDYAASIGGESCTSFVRDETEDDRWSNFLMRTDASEIDFSSGTTVKVDVYFPSSNDYSGDLTQKVWIRFIDESRLGGNFWQEYIQLESADVPTDTWTTLTFDFATSISDGAAAGNSPDGVMIEFGGSNHLVGGTFYAKNWIIE